MPYSLIRADEIVRAGLPRPLVYLGGNCRGRDWRLDFYHRFEQSDVTFINPRRDQFVDPELDPSSHAHQVDWERQALDKCDLAVFWLGGGLANQAARVEIGYSLGLDKPTLIGAEDGFLGLEHLSAFSGLVLSKTMDGLMNRFASVLASFNQ
ncbi:MAG: nucleoside 2-deoxyribosyltransferase domain-containing protein [Alphaproteobacteria bacterium]|nr:nucleoside 2-deoxyribosyltransferase domain-containing protein [Alphaproteobacteria bacterium]MDD9919217.1 nucleoside 2-deoxyribosyltransferase domain-containing protein [Alphaproteobacteria bacterium]